ncbi:MAG: hypothetical protein U5N85_00270 [Arcicella sp.]|nr:hypothetical protein [Arcicella sp.]
MELQELSIISYNDFKGFLNQEFKIKFETNVTLPAVLIEATEFANNFSPVARKPFSIVLRTQQKNEYYPQATFVIEHPEKGEIPLFLVPKGFDAEGMKYEAVFS